MPNQAITLYTIIAKVRISNKVAIFCSCKKICSPKSWCKCQKQKLKCIQYYYFLARDCGNIGIIEEGTEIAVIKRSIQISNSNSLPFLLSDLDNNLSLLSPPA